MVEGLTVVVTGAATGIGEAIAKGFVEAGANVIGIDKTPKDSADGVEMLQADLTVPAEVERCFSEIERRHGGVDVLVNNAALAAEVDPTPFEEISPEEWTRVVTTNTIMPFLCSRAVVPLMRRKKWGRIINLTSSTVFLGGPLLLHYSASKGAIATMTHSLAKEVGKDGINVNAVAPGMTLTQGIKDNPAYTDEKLANSVKARAIQRAEEPEDLVGVCLFLASDGADFMTGQILAVDGGAVLH